MTELLSDEHEVPTQLGERVPMLPLLFPLDWTDRQVYAMGAAFYFGSDRLSTAHSLGDVLVAVIYWYLGFVAVSLEYVTKPTPEFWISAVLEYLAILLVSFPLWCRRLLPPYGRGLAWPLATMPHWLGGLLVSNVEVLPDGVLRLPGTLGRPARFAVVIGIVPRPHPDMLPELLRATIIQARLGIFRLIRGRWSLHLQVVPFDTAALEIASGPAWGWVKLNMLSRMVGRRPSLVIYGKNSEELLSQSTALLDRFWQANMSAWQKSSGEAHQLGRELWSDLVAGPSSGRVRIGVRRVVTGMIGYRSWALTAFPRIIHLSWLRPLTSEALLCSLAFHVNVRPPAATRRWLQRNIRRWRAVDQDDDYELAVEDAQNTLAAMRRNLDTAASVGLYVTARQEEAQKVQEALESAQAEFRPADLMQHRALRAVLPLGGDPYNRLMKADLRSVAATDLLATAGYWPTNGTLIGEGLSAPEPIALDLFDEEVNFNWAMFVAILMGGGKTTFAQTLAWRMANPHPDHELAKRPIRVVTIDFKKSGDYANLYRHLADRGQKASYYSWEPGPLPEIEGHLGFNLSDVPEDEHGARLLEIGERIEEWTDRHEGHRLLLIIDEVLALLEVRGGPRLIRRLGTQSRSSVCAPVFCTQDIEPVLANIRAAQAFKNCGHLFIGRQTPAAIHGIAELLDLDVGAQQLLAGAPQGGGLLRIERKREGPVVLGMQVMPTPWELAEFGTNPSERAARYRRDRTRAPVLSGRDNGNGKGWHGNGRSDDLDDPVGVDGSWANGVAPES